MSEFSYQAQNPTGRVNDAATRHEAPPVELADYVKPGKGVKQDDVIFFATQMAVMVDTGVPLTEALDAIGDQSTNPGMQALIREVSEDVKGGTELSASLDKHPRIFGNLFVALMKASEASGTMGGMLQRVSEYLEEQRKIRKKVKGAMTYPICMLSFCVLVVIGLLVFILPRFEKIYGSKGAVLPVPTQILLAISHALTGYWYVILGCLGAVIAAAIWYVRTPAGRAVLDRLRISIPLIGPMYRKACLSRSLQTLATMLSSGVPVLESLEITAKVAGNEYYRQVWLDLAESTKEGSSLAEQLYRSDLVPATVTQMIDAGERSGRLPMVMDRVAKFCEDDLKARIQALTSLIEPAMIITMGIIVGGVAMALLLPVFSLSKVVAK